MQGIIEDQTEKYERLLSITQEMEDELDLLEFEKQMDKKKILH